MANAPPTAAASPPTEPSMASTARPSQQETSSSTPSLRVQIVSDLHLEFYRPRSADGFDHVVTPNAPVLALLGDIGLACTASLRSYLHRQAERFETVLFLAGNHEYYNVGNDRRSIEEQTEWMQRVCDERPNLHFLNRDAIVLNGVLVCGTTLWSEIPDERLIQAEMSLNDYNLSFNHRRGEEPRSLTAIETRNEHRLDVQWLEKELEEARRDGLPVLVLTHHTPLVRGTSHPKYDGSATNCCFSSDLRRLLVDPVVAWGCGHTHYNFDIIRESGVRVVSNQRGYKGGINQDYDPNGVVVEISSSLRDKTVGKGR